MRVLLRLSASILVLLLAAQGARAAHFETSNKPDGGNSITFEVTAPLESIVGTSDGVTGQLAFDPKNIKSSLQGTFTADVAAFNTGIDLRDEHFRDRFLETDKHPQAVFSIDRVVSASKNEISSGESVELEVEGTLELHGVKKRETAKARLTYMQASEATQGILPGNIVAIDAHFKVALADYQIQRPQMLVLRVGETVDINVASRLTDAPHELQVAAKCDGGCGGCGGCGN